MSKVFFIGFVVSLLAMAFLIIKIKIQERKIKKETEIKKEELNKAYEKKEEELKKINSGDNVVDFDNSINFLHNSANRRK